MAKPLPSITRFVAGLVTNRNPLDTPFSVVGMNVVQHHDALIDGLNTEVTNNNTLARRPGYSAFIGAANTPRDFFQYKDLSGNISLFYDEGGALYKDTTQASASVGPNLWSLVGAGNFVYGVNGNTAVRFNNTALTSAISMGLAPLQQPPRVNINTNSTPYFISDFVPTGNTINGLMTVSDTNGQRVLTITIGSAAVHFNVTYSGLSITENDQYTNVTATTTSGTAPTITTSSVTSVTSGMTGTATGTGITNGKVAYYPSQGVATLDFDVAYTAPMTMAVLVASITSAAAATTSSTNIPANVLVPLAVFVSALVVNGQVASTLYPDTAATAISLSWNGK